MEKSDLSFNTYVQCVEDFKFWVLAVGNAHRLKRDRENIGRDIIVISHERIKCPEPKKDAKDRSTDGPISRKQRIYIKTPSEACFAKETKISNPAKTMDLKDVECFKCDKKGN